MAGPCVIINLGPIAHGIIEPKPIKDLPPGARVKIRQRAGEMIQAFVKSEGIVRHWLVLNEGDHWILGHLMGENRTVTT